ncbi:MAG: pyruvate, phosphate dikinase [Robiginitomaculum sp.]|nr:pyruvate, phosphate dikinase [Robiginitomaculum sp.]MDQ7077129.1 pyruvate, phosphate dikinase [Robiginitomaculum sp.]
MSDKASKKKWVYAFGGGSAEGNAGMKNLLGGKGANLAEMCALGLPVPPGFTITTKVCTAFYENDRAYPDGLIEQVEAALADLEEKTGKRFGDPKNPLLVSVRSGGRASMPGMMDTVLNLGLNADTVAGLAARSGDARFAWDSYRRFIQMYSNVVLGLDHDVFEELLDDYKDDQGYEVDTDLNAKDWEVIAGRYLRQVEEDLEKPFPDDPKDQLWGAIGAVFGSWMNNRAITYRQLHDIPQSWGTAVNVQAMVFGNMGDTSATGVAFTRDPSTGQKSIYGEFLINAQGEDVVAGIRTPQVLTKQAREDMGETEPSLEEAMPDIYAELATVFQKLEDHYRDMQDIEFTVEEGRLWMLQTRAGKRTAMASLRIAVEMANEGTISRDEAVLRVDPAALDQLLHPALDEGSDCPIIATGLPASPGAAIGQVVFDADEAEAMAKNGIDVILVRTETSPEDIHGMHAAKGIVTARGGMTSHAAVVARGMGRPCVSGVGAIRIDHKAGRFSAHGITVNKGDIITIDGAKGAVFKGAGRMIQPQMSGDFSVLMGWADAARRMKVRTNADTPADVKTALRFGAEGIGLCRTEHMFFDEERIAAVREMILATTREDRVGALDKILPMQRDDFVQIFTLMAGLPVTIRLLDPPLHEFLPHNADDVEAVAKATGISVDALMARARELAESNPMLGHRGCRLGVTYPEIYEMQARAIFEAAAIVREKSGTAPQVEVMIPLAATGEELEFLKTRVAEVAEAVGKEAGAPIEYAYGAMIELPRAALRADELAQYAEFFSFGTNDLTQTTFGLSRDDASSFLNTYLAKGMLAQDPFISLDQDGVGDLIRMGVARGRAERPDIKLGICGEHGGDPASIGFCEKTGLDYVSCSPYRVPIARLAAAQAALQRARKKARKKKKK